MQTEQRTRLQQQQGWALLGWKLGMEIGLADRTKQGMLLEPALGLELGGTKGRAY